MKEIHFYSWKEFCQLENTSIKEKKRKEKEKRETDFSQLVQFPWDGDFN